MLPENAVHTLGHASQLLQIMPGRIQQAIDELGIRPAVVINGKPHFAEADLDRVRKMLTGPPVGGDLQHRAQRLT